MQIIHVPPECTKREPLARCLGWLHACPPWTTRWKRSKAALIVTSMQSKEESSPQSHCREGFPRLTHSRDYTRRAKPSTTVFLTMDRRIGSDSFSSSITVHL